MGVGEERKHSGVDYRESALLIHGKCGDSLVDGLLEHGDEVFVADAGQGFESHVDSPEFAVVVGCEVLVCGDEFITTSLDDSVEDGPTRGAAYGCLVIGAGQEGGQRDGAYFERHGMNGLLYMGGNAEAVEHGPLVNVVEDKDDFCRQQGAEVFFQPDMILEDAGFGGEEVGQVQRTLQSRQPA